MSHAVEHVLERYQRLYSFGNRGNAELPGRALQRHNQHCRDARLKLLKRYLRSVPELDAIAVATMIEVDERHFFVRSHTEFVLQCLGDTLKPQLAYHLGRTPQLSNPQARRARSSRPRTA